MPKFKVTLSCTPEEIKYLKKRECYPYQRGGEEFSEGTVVYADSIIKFAANSKHPYNKRTGKLILDPRLSYEEINEDSETTD